MWFILQRTSSPARLERVFCVHVVLCCGWYWCSSVFVCHSLQFSIFWCFRFHHEDLCWASFLVALNQDHEECRHRLSTVAWSLLCSCFGAVHDIFRRLCLFNNPHMIVSIAGLALSRSWLRTCRMQSQALPIGWHEGFCKFWEWACAGTKFEDLFLWQITQSGAIQCAFTITWLHYCVYRPMLRCFISLLLVKWLVIYVCSCNMTQE